MNDVVIAIPSKGRYMETLKVFNVLDIDPKKIFIFTEKAEYYFYQQKYAGLANLIDLEKDNIGIGAKRKMIVDFFKDTPNTTILMMDDNVDSFSTREGFTEAGYPKLESLKITEQVLQHCAEIMENKNLLQMGVSFQPSNWLVEEDFKSNSRCWGCFFINIEKLKNDNDMNFDEKVEICEDFDFTITAIKKNYKIGVTYVYAFSKKMTCGNSIGGNSHIYSNKNLTKGQTEYLALKHSNCVECYFNKEHGIWEIKISWANVKPVMKHSWW